MFRNDLLHKKRILITGGGTGLGKGMAQRFLKLGAEVYICGRREEVLKNTAAELSSATRGRMARVANRPKSRSRSSRNQAGCRARITLIE